MDCICGCGTRLSRGLIEANVNAGEVGLELLVWDKARISLDPASADAATVERVIEPGARHYQDCLAVLHGDRPIGPFTAANRWLAESRRERKAMATGRSFVPKGKIKLSEDDFARFDGRRPERSFTGERATEAEDGSFWAPAAAPERADDDPVAQLKGLRELHAAGALTDAEFAAAKARVIARLG